MPLSFYAQWYAREYPDVVLSGMDPEKHYLWIGKRLNRLPVPPQERDSDRLSSIDGTSSVGKAIDDLVIVNALEKLCNWLIPEYCVRKGSYDAQELFKAIRWDFGNIQDNGITCSPEHVKKLVNLMNRYSDGVNSEHFRDLENRPRAVNSILLASFYAPTLMHAGGLRLLDTYALIRERAPHVHLTLFAPRNEAVDGDVSILHNIFDEIYFCQPEQFHMEWLKARLRPGQYFSLADLQFHQAGNMAQDIRALARRVIFTPMETLSRFAFDEARQKALEGELAQDRIFGLIHDGVQECAIMDNVDMTVCVSDADANFLAKIAGESQVNYYPTGLSAIEFKRELDPHYKAPLYTDKHNRLVFAAYFGSETNRYGLQWYLEKVHPQVLAAVPDYDLAVVGRGDTSELKSPALRNVHFIGEVPNLAPVLEQAKAGLVLALNGSGFRGKINQYALCGLPAISTTLGVTGLNYEHDKNILVADGADDFAKACVALLTDAVKGEALAKAARQQALDYYSWKSIWPRIAAIYGLRFYDGDGDADVNDKTRYG